MTVERIHPKAPVMLIFIAIFTCLPGCINLSNNEITHCVFQRQSTLLYYECHTAILTREYVHCTVFATIIRNMRNQSKNDHMHGRNYTFNTKVHIMYLYSY